MMTDTAPRLNNYCKVKTDFPDADFWIVRKGSEQAVGKPTKTFSPEYIGIKVERPDLLLPQYLFYYMEYLWGQGFMKQFALGSLKLKHIPLDKVAKLPLHFRR